MALANKYRPKSWQEVIGQPTIISILSRQVATKSWKNAYLFCGAHGAGKTTVARILANEVNGGEGSPIEIDGASNNGVDNIRSLSAEAQQMSIDCEYKIFIIDEAHQLTRAAWDAALKLIEEPPSNAIFIFCTTNPDKIPETILSRVQRFDFRRVSNKEIADRLAFILNEETHNDYERGALERIASLADGHVRDAIQYLDKCLDMSQEITMDVVETALGLVKYNSIQKFSDNLYDLNLSGTLSELEHIKTFNTDLCRFYDSLVSYSIDMAIKSITGKNDYTDVPSEFNGNIPEEGLASYLVERLVNYRRFMNQSNVESLIKAIVIEMCEVFKADGAARKPYKLGGDTN